MDIIADLHIHSRYSRACSKSITLANLEKYARIKGINLLGTGDFLHPKWNKEIKENLREDEKGILWSKTNFPFLWQTEISLMYSDGKRRAVHLVMLSPGKEVTDQIIDVLGKRFRIDYDGRPIFGISSPEFVELMKGIDDKIEIIPAHSMTSWFGFLGSKSGFDSLKECFKEKANKIYAIESGMSADPQMLYRLKENVNIVSFSDSHSFWPFRLGREATIFDIKELTYDNIIKAIRTGNGLKGTIEVFPAYGKYHVDGHRNCNFSCSYEESMKLNKICPVCKKELTIGVEYRIEELAKEKEGFKPDNAKETFEVIPLQEVIAAVYGISQMNSKKVLEIYNHLMSAFGNEFNVLLRASFDELKKVVDERLAMVIIMNRNNEIKIKPGYDGVYGIPIINKENLIKHQRSLKEF